ncbi:MAG: M42 family peptidase [Oscillospiraceae bacterium]|nr:M42 family peptidase [Oscillospiraceae bacterium]
MLNEIKALCALNGISGNEDRVREYILNRIKGKCEYHTDALGNIIAFCKGRRDGGKKLMVAAHMDEVGLLITYINEDGTLAFDAVGGINTDIIAGRQVYVYERNVTGVVSAKAVHHLSDKERKEPLDISSLYIDIGAKSREEAEKLVSVGDCVAFKSEFETLGGDRICSKALDDRAGCAIMLSLIDEGVDYDTYFVFSVEEEIGLRGAQTAAFAVEPEFAIVIETTTAADISGASGAKRVCELGKGAVLSYRDRRTVYDKELYDLAFSLGKQNNIACQTKTLIAGGNDAGAIHISKSGVRTIAVSAPCRYLHSPSCTAQYSDIEMSKALVRLLITGINEL